MLVSDKINLSATTPKGTLSFKNSFKKSFASCADVGVPSVITVAVLSELNFASIFLLVFVPGWLIPALP